MGALRFTTASLAGIEPVHYTGTVWCLRVPTGAFVARRNGKVFVTGNSGFPKGKSCLKPAWEPIILARKPGPMRELGIESCRVGIDESERAVIDSRSGADDGQRDGIYHDGVGKRAAGQRFKSAPSGRWPANIVLDEEAGAMLDGQTGTLKSGIINPRTVTKPTHAGTSFPSGARSTDATFGGDSGGASRFFYCAKASRSERGEGNGHPTVKPTALMRWLVRLVARPGDVVLDPFAGSGTTGVACAMEGREFIGIERELDYVEISRRRIEAASSQTRLPV